MHTYFIYFPNQKVTASYKTIRELLKSEVQEYMSSIEYKGKEEVDIEYDEKYEPEIIDYIEYEEKYAPEIMDYIEYDEKYEQEIIDCVKNIGVFTQFGEEDDVKWMLFEDVDGDEWIVLEERVFGSEPEDIVFLTKCYDTFSVVSRGGTHIFETDGFAEALKLFLETCAEVERNTFDNSEN